MSKGGRNEEGKRERKRGGEEGREREGGRVKERKKKEAMEACILLDIT